MANPEQHPAEPVYRVRDIVRNPDGTTTAYYEVGDAGVPHAPAASPEWQEGGREFTAPVGQGMELHYKGPEIHIRSTGQAHVVPPQDAYLPPARTHQAEPGQYPTSYEQPVGAPMQQLANAEYVAPAADTTDDEEPIPEGRRKFLTKGRLRIGKAAVAALIPYAVFVGGAQYVDDDAPYIAKYEDVERGVMFVTWAPRHIGKLAMFAKGVLS